MSPAQRHQPPMRPGGFQLTTNWTSDLPSCWNFYKLQHSISFLQVGSYKIADGKRHSIERSTSPSISSVSISAKSAQECKHVSMYFRYTEVVSQWCCSEFGFQVRPRHESEFVNTHEPGFSRESAYSNLASICARNGQPS